MRSIVFILYSLKEGVDAETFETRAREVEARLASRSRAINSYTLTRITKCMTDGDVSPYDYIEILEISDPEGYAAEGSKPDVSAFLREWERDVKSYLALGGDTVAES